MKRRNFNKKEEDVLQKLKRENDGLKKQVTSLRKQIQRIDLDRYENLKDLLNKYNATDLEEELEYQQSSLKKKWECFHCGEGFLKLYTINRLDKIVYYRKCTDCSHRTTIKPYNDDVKGIKDEE